MFNIISLAVNEVLFYVHTVFDYLFLRTSFGWISLALRPILLIGVGISILFFTIKIIRSTVWGR